MFKRLMRTFRGKSLRVKGDCGLAWETMGTAKIRTCANAIQIHPAMQRTSDKPIVCKNHPKSIRTFSVLTTWS